MLKQKCYAWLTKTWKTVSSVFNNTYTELALGGISFISPIVMLFFVENTVAVWLLGIYLVTDTVLSIKYLLEKNND